MSQAKVDKVIGENLTVLKYNTLKSIIPIQWRKSLKNIEGKVEVVSQKNGHTSTKNQHFMETT